MTDKFFASLKQVNMPNSSPSVSLAFILALSLFATPANSAVRMCGALIEGSVFTTETQLEAKKLALADWTKRVSRLGPAFESWRIAADKKISCQAIGALFSCRAMARPCSLSQVAPTQKTMPRSM